MDFVIRHIFNPHISTASKFGVKMFSLICIEISLDFHILLSTMKAALSFPILALTVPPFVSTVLPRYVKDCTSSRTSPCSVSGLLIFMILVLLLFTFSPNVAAVVSINDVFLAFTSGCVKEEPGHLLLVA